MGLKKLFLITVLAGAMSVLGCGDDGNGNGGNGATGGAGATGGSGATGGGGAGGGSTAEELCSIGLCLDQPARFDECLDAVNLCFTEPNCDPENAAAAKCNPG